MRRERLFTPIRRRCASLAQRRPPKAQPWPEFARRKKPPPWENYCSPIRRPRPRRSRFARRTDQPRRSASSAAPPEIRSGCFCNFSALSTRASRRFPRRTPEKDDEDFLLQSAEWPVLLVHKNGRVLRANRAGVRAFGASIEREEAQLEAIWSPHNRDSCQQFLNLPPPAEPVPLKFHLKSGLPGDYWGQLCATGQEDVFLLQLLKGPPPGPKRPANQNRRRRRRSRRRTAQPGEGRRPIWPTSKSWIARCNWRARSRWISTTR